ncbi:hypothetical protein DH09_14025 [Bacillaceae bacterium JMAK1]|nr:hypothetical protein DH09_14025 [Bacillaceae bacterium JMAK1]
MDDDEIKKLPKVQQRILKKAMEIRPNKDQTLTKEEFTQVILDVYDKKLKNYRKNKNKYR